jgi:hypothetical protein
MLSILGMADKHHDRRTKLDNEDENGRKKNRASSRHRGRREGA